MSEPAQIWKGDSGNEWTFTRSNETEFLKSSTRLIEIALELRLHELSMSASTLLSLWRELLQQLNPPF